MKLSRINRLKLAGLGESTVTDERKLAALFERIPDGVNNDPDMLRRGRWCDANCLVEIGNTSFFLVFKRGRIERLERGAPLMRSWDFALRGPTEAWRGIWAREPEPGYHDIFALSKKRLLRIEGNLQPLMANLQYVKDVLAWPRRWDHEGKSDAR
jgi:hypothetical protein